MNDFKYAEITPADVAELLAGANSLFEDYAEVNTRSVGAVVEVKLWRANGEAERFRAVVVKGEGPVVIASPEFLAAARALYRWHVASPSLAREPYAALLYEVEDALAALTPEQVAVLAGEDPEAAQAQTGGDDA